MDDSIDREDLFSILFFYSGGIAEKIRKTLWKLWRIEYGMGKTLNRIRGLSERVTRVSPTGPLAGAAAFENQSQFRTRPRGEISFLPWDPD